ncbi:MAG: hypothetical protein FK734_09605 [Asgard group archaeon]|nr:hypothetical protein [Asgard group archaeon]
MQEITQKSTDDFYQRRILIDEAHEPYYSASHNSIIFYYQYTLRALKDELTQMGHLVDILNQGEVLTETKLSSYDLLLIPPSVAYHYNDELYAIENWLEGGDKGLLFIFLGYTNDNMQDLLYNYGFEFTNQGYSLVDINDYEGSETEVIFDWGNIATNEITANIHTIRCRENYYIKTKPVSAFNVILTDGDNTAFYGYYDEYYEGNYYIERYARYDNLMVAYDYQTSLLKHSRIIVSGLTTLWTTYPVNEPYLDYDDEEYLYNYDNLQLAFNSINWLLNCSDLMVIDSDNDTIIDYSEINYYHSNPYSNDTDGDNLLDNVEQALHLSLINNDTDMDGLTDYDELYLYFTNPLNDDCDNDQLNDGDEILLYNTDPYVKDTDTDGIPDGYEVMNFMQPTNSSDASEDFDSDGVTNLEEYIHQSNIYSSDTDNDLIPDYDEIYLYNTKAYSNDTDWDLLSDYEELAIYGTDPRDQDTDDDYYNDYYEVSVLGSDPLDPNDPTPQTTLVPITHSTISISIEFLWIVLPLIFISVIINLIRRKYH